MKFLTIRDEDGYSIINYLVMYLGALFASILLVLLVPASIYLLLSVDSLIISFGLILIIPTFIFLVLTRI